MKKTVYIQPLIEAINAETEDLLTVSPVTSTDIPGLGIDETPTDEEGHVRSILNAFFE